MAWPVWILHVAGTIEVCSPNVSFFGAGFMFVYPSTCLALLICSLNFSNFTFKSVKHHCRNTHTHTHKGTEDQELRNLEKQCPVDEGEGVRRKGLAAGRPVEGVRGSQSGQYLLEKEPSVEEE